MSTYASLFGAVAPVFIMLVIGWIMRRTGALKSEADSSILRLGVNVFYPALITDTILGNEALRHLGNVVLPAAVGAGTTLLGFGVAMAVARMLRLPGTKAARSFAFSVGLQNYGFIAIPLVQVLFGRSALGVQFTFTLGVELVLWSVGVWLLSGHRGNGTWKAILTAPVMAIIVSTAVNYFASADWLPGFGRTSLQWLGACTFPSQIILTGAVLADVMRRLEPGSWIKAISFGNLVRLGVLPVLILGIGSLLGASMELKHVIVVQAAMPSAMIPVILVKHYEGEVDLSAWIVTSTTALGFFTIPLWLSAGMWWMGAS
jgi:predicted permease